MTIKIDENFRLGPEFLEYEALTSAVGVAIRESTASNVLAAMNVFPRTKRVARAQIAIRAANAALALASASVMRSLGMNDPDEDPDNLVAIAICHFLIDTYKEGARNRKENASVVGAQSD